MPGGGGLNPAAALLGAAAGAIAYQAAWREPRSLVCPEIELELPRWPAALDGLRVALFADLHAGAGHMTPARVASVVDAVIGLRADVNLLLGDFLDSTALGRGRARVHDVAAELARIPNAAAVLGNHDWRGAGPAMRWALLDAGVRLLENEAVELRPGLWVAGTADLRHRHVSLAASLRAVPEDAAVLLCTHDPDLFPRVPGRVALTVAGHIHGGQVNVPILRRAVLPTRYGDRYLHGHVVEGGAASLRVVRPRDRGAAAAPAPAARAPRPAARAGRSARGRFLEHPTPDQLGVHAVVRHQLVVIAGFDDPAAVERDDEIRVLHRGEAVRDDHHGAAQLAQVVGDARLGRHVERARGLVEDQHARPVNQRAGEDEALALAAESAAPPSATMVS